MRDQFVQGWYMAIPGFPYGNGSSHLEAHPEQDTVVRAVFVPNHYRTSVETDSLLVERGTVEIEASGADAVMANAGTVTIKSEAERGLSVRPLEGRLSAKHPERQRRARDGDQAYKGSVQGAGQVVIAAVRGGTVTCNGIEVTRRPIPSRLGQTLP